VFHASNIIKLWKVDTKNKRKVVERVLKWMYFLVFWGGNLQYDRGHIREKYGKYTEEIRGRYGEEPF
jgi:hypothetical protein